MRALKAAMSSGVNDSLTRVADGGRFAVHRPGRHSLRGRIGRGAKPPPQLGHTLRKCVSTQSAQKVHSKVQMRARTSSGGRSVSHYSQLGRSARAIGISIGRPQHA